MSQSSPREEPAKSVQASTLFLFDAPRNSYALSYPFWLAAVLTISGIAAFAFVGFLGYPTDPSIVYYLFHPAWSLFLWFCAMILILQISIFRHHESRMWRWQTVSVTVASIVLVAALYSKPDVLRQGLNLVIDLLNALGISVERGRILWNLANFLPIIWYTIDRLILWARGKRKEYTNRFLDLDPTHILGSQQKGVPLTGWELCSQDLFAGAALSLVLGVIFQVQVLSSLATQVSGLSLNDCAVSWAIGRCQLGAVYNPPTLTSIDLAIAFFAIALASLILTVLLVPRAFFAPEQTGADLVAGSVRQTLAAILNPIDIFFRNLRTVLWPALTFLGVIGAASAARYVRLYLHVLSDKQTCRGTSNCQDLQELGLFLSNSTSAPRFQSQALELELLFFALALLGGVLGALFVSASARILIAERPLEGKLWTNWLLFLRKTLSRVLLAFWIASLTLSALQLAFNHVDLTSRSPFPQPGISTSISFAYFAVVWGARFLRKPGSRVKALAGIAGGRGRGDQTSA